MKKMMYSLVLLAAAAAITGCSADGNKPNVEPIQDMMESPAHKSQDYDRETKKPTMLVPPAGTWPVGKKKYLYGAADVAAAERNVKNPHAGNVKAEFLARGADQYRIYCSVCHGTTGAGDGPVAVKMPIKPPSLINDKIKNVSDGRIYHIITRGQGVMGSYAAQITNEDDRWAIINHIRTLQQK